MSVLGKIKAAGRTAADSIGRSVEYAKGKASHFEHPPGVNDRIISFRMDREQIPKYMNFFVNFAAKFTPSHVQAL